MNLMIMDPIKKINRFLKEMIIFIIKKALKINKQNQKIIIVSYNHQKIFPIIRMMNRVNKIAIKTNNKLIKIRKNNWKIMKMWENNRIIINKWINNWKIKYRTSIYLKIREPNK
jgi:hypothetical protein